MSAASMSEHASTAELITRFQRWLEDAGKSEINDPNAMSLATADANGMPSVRMVLLKHADEAGFVFYTNLESQKGCELAINPQAAVCFHWKSLQRQVRIQGQVTPVSEAEADAYFASRARDSRIGAWASKQSRPMEGRFELEKRVAEKALHFNIGAIPRPDFWSGFRIVPASMEFWEAKPFRLHDRKRFVRQGDDNWQGTPLFP